MEFILILFGLQTKAAYCLCVLSTSRWHHTLWNGEVALIGMAELTSAVISFHLAPAALVTCAIHADDYHQWNASGMAFQDCRVHDGLQLVCGTWEQNTPTYSK